MKIQVVEGDWETTQSEAAVFVHFEGEAIPAGGAAARDERMQRLISGVLGLGDFKGKKNEITVLYTYEGCPVKRLVLAGLGKRSDFSPDRLRGAFSRAAQHIRSVNVTGFSTYIASDGIELPVDAFAEYAVEGVVLGLYQYLPFKTVDRKDDQEISACQFIVEKSDSNAVRAAVKRAEIVTDAVNYARDLVSAPGNEMTPTDLAGEALASLKGNNLNCSVITEAKMKELGMNALLGVARGSRQPPKMIIADYRGGKNGDKPIALVGKGITFDSGGISLKPADKMDLMKTDMAGGAAVIATLRAAAELSLPLNIVGIVPATENMPGGNANKPGDILRSMSGLTIEVINTDAEGRLILADALTYAAVTFDPAAIIDLATLTGACVVALGDDVIGMLGNDPEMKGRLREASAATGEKLWELPLGEQFDELIKSDVADYRNQAGRAGAASIAAAFLNKFVGDCKWVHLDIAGPAWVEKNRPYIPKGASGIGVRLLLHLLGDMAKKQGERPECQADDLQTEVKAPIRRRNVVVRKKK
jgi:leucyl aminopeptidase